MPQEVILETEKEGPVVLLVMVDIIPIDLVVDVVVSSDAPGSGDGGPPGDNNGAG